MLNRLKIYLPFICAILIIIVVLLIIVGRRSVPPGIKQSSSTPVIRIVSPTITIPDNSSEKIKISGIEIKNVYKNPVSLNQAGDVVFFKEANYQFSYQPQFKKFIISLLTSSFWEEKKKAEEDFIQSLMITKKDACWLNVEVIAPRFAGSAEEGRIYPLSFCTDN